MTHRDNCEKYVKMFLETLSNDARVLELGAFTDKQFRNIFENKGMKYTGLDKLDVSNGDNCFIGVMENIPFKNDSFDFVFACHAFEHTERPIDTLKEVKRVLNKGGSLMFITPFHCEHQVLKADNDHINVVTDMQMVRMLRYCGFTDINVQTITPDNFKIQDYFVVSIARKP